MDYYDMLTAERIDSETADLVDRLLKQAPPAPCSQSLDAVLTEIGARYPLSALPETDARCAQTALAVIEADFPEDADYLPGDWDERLAQATRLIPALHLRLFCAEVLDEGAGHALYERQRAQFAAAGTERTWRRRPIYILAESSTGYCLVLGSERLRAELIFLRGISQEEIDQRSPAFIAFLRAREELSLDTTSYTG